MLPLLDIIEFWFVQFNRTFVYTLIAIRAAVGMGEQIHLIAY